MKTSVRNSIYINRSPEVVAGVLLDPSKVILWTSDLEKFEVISKEPGLVGSKARLHYIEGSRRYVMEDHLLEVDPNRRYLSRVSGDAIDAKVETFLKPAGAGTQMEVHWTGNGKHLLLKLILPFMQKNIARQAQKDLEKLKELVESI
jgi:carbon monoxide dehydrogenase subunit G